jgi:endoglucanase
VAFDRIEDPQDHFAFEIHQYLDSDYSGTHETCQAPETGPRTLVRVTEWLRERGKHGFLGEFGAAANEGCLAALEHLLRFLEENRDVWIGWTYWAAGPWWGAYPLSVQPSKEGPRPQMEVLVRHTQTQGR